MPQQLPVVFISSTKEDLEACRVAAQLAAIRAGFFPRMMEGFVAEGAKPPCAKCMAEVGKADVLVVIVAHRYGWVPPDQPPPGGKSITWLECEQARENGREVLAFLVDRNADWPETLKESYRTSEAIEVGGGMQSGTGRGSDPERGEAEGVQGVAERAGNLREFHQPK